MPETPTDVVIKPTYNGNNLFLSQLEVQWKVQASGSVFSVSLIPWQVSCGLIGIEGVG